MKLTQVKINEDAIKKLKERNLFGLEREFPDLSIRIYERDQLVSFRGGNYRKKQVMMKIFLELQNININQPR